MKIFNSTLNRTVGGVIRVAGLLLLPLMAFASAPAQFPKPDPEHYLSAFKIYQPDGSVLRTPIEDWAGARARIGSDAEWSAWLDKQRATVDGWMSRHQDRPGWPAGRGHDFVSPTDGAPLIWTDDVPGEDIDHLKSRGGESVAVTPKILAAWVDKFRKQHVDMTTDAARLYRLTGEQRYADWAAGQLDFYADNLMAWSDRGLPGHGAARLGVMAFNDAVMIARLIETARLLFDTVTPARRQHWFDGLFKPEVELLESVKPGLHNHTVWNAVARAQVALLYRDEPMWNRAVEDDTEHGLRAQIRRGVTSDYLWFEQSVGYNDFVIMAFEPLITFAGLLGEGRRLVHEASVVQNMMWFSSVIRFPDSTVPNPSDSVAEYRAPSGRIGSSYRILPTRLGLERAKRTRSWDTLLDPPADIPTGIYRSDTKLPVVVSRNLESSRMALLKEGPWQVFFHYGQLGRPHVQGEALNWSASYGKTIISRDPGTVGYGSSLYGGYYRRGLCHNVPLVAGEGQEPWEPGRLIAFDADAATVAAAQDRYRPGVSARRTLRIDGDALVDEATVQLDAADATPVRLGLALHMMGEPRLGDGFRPIANGVFSMGRPKAFSHWSDVRAATFTDHAEVDVVFSGGLVLRVSFTAPGEFTLYQGSAPDRPPGRHAAFFLETKTLRQATFTTRIAPAASHD